MFKHVKELCTIDIESYYTEKGRYYITPNGNHYPSVTTVLGNASDGDWLDEWRQRVGNEEADRVSRFAAQRGTSFHEMAEAYLKNDPDYKKGRLPIEKSNLFSIKKHLDEHVGLIVGLEIPLWSDELRIAGRTDLICKWDNEWAVCDFKTSRRVKERDDILGYFRQKSAYAFMFNERYGLSIDKIVTIMAIDGGKSKIFVESAADHIDDYKKLREKVSYL